MKPQSGSKFGIYTKGDLETNLICGIRDRSVLRSFNAWNETKQATGAPEGEKKKNREYNQIIKTKNI